jgi:hypothetical protein
LELRGDLMNPVKNSNNDTLVRLECQEFAVSYEKKKWHSHTLEIALKSLVMEDLQLDVNSRHRKLMTSISDDSNNPKVYKAFATSGLSSSCPDSHHWQQQPAGGMSSGTSLPDRGAIHQF